MPISHKNEKSSRMPVLIGVTIPVFSCHLYKIKQNYPMRSMHKILFILSCILFSYLVINFGGVFESDIRLVIIFSIPLSLFSAFTFRRFKSLLFINLLLVLSLFYQIIYLPQPLLKTLSPEAHAIYSSIIPLYADPSESFILKKLALEENIEGYKLLVSQVYQDRGYNPLVIPEHTKSQPPAFLTQSSWRTTLTLTAMYIIALFTGISFTRSHRRSLEKIFIFFICVLSLVQIVIGYSSLFSNDPMHLGYSRRYMLTVFTGTYVNRNHIASLLLMFALVLSGHLLSAFYKSIKNNHSKKIKNIILNIYHSRQWYFLLLFPLICGITAAIFTTQSRMGVFSFLSALCAFLILYFIMFSSNRKLYSAISVGVIIIIILFSFRIFIHDDDLADLVDRYEKIHMDNIRFTTYQNALEILELFPVTGIGMGNTPLILSAYIKGRSKSIQGKFGYWLAYLHNDILQFILEGGIISLIIILVFFWDIIKKLLLSLKQKRIKNLGYFCALLGVIIHSTMDFSLHIPSNLFLFMMIYGFLSMESKSNTRPE